MVSMAEFKPKGYVFILAKMRFAKIVSVREKGNLLTLWVKCDGQEFPMHTIKGSNTFNLKLGIPTTSLVVKAETLVNIFALLVLIVLVLNYFS